MSTTDFQQKVNTSDVFFSINQVQRRFFLLCLFIYPTQYTSTETTIRADHNW